MSPVLTVLFSEFPVYGESLAVVPGFFLALSKKGGSAWI
jgi:hypothetical protein